MAHSYPPGEQARWNELERRILLSDVDIKRLWKAMPEQGIASPAFDGVIPEPASQYKVLVARIGAFATGTSNLVGIHNTAFGVSGNLAIGVGETSATAEQQDLDQYDLIYIWFASNGTAQSASWLSAANVNTWLSAAKQRRLVLVAYARPTSGAAYNYFSDLGIALDIDQFPAPLVSTTATAVATASAHYLASGTTLKFGNDVPNATGGSLLFSWAGDASPGDVGRIVTTGSGSEIVYLSANASIFGYALDNVSFLTRLYPSASYGGMLIP